MIILGNGGDPHNTARDIGRIAVHILKDDAQVIALEQFVHRARQGRARRAVDFLGRAVGHPVIDQLARIELDRARVPGLVFRNEKSCHRYSPCS